MGSIDDEIRAELEKEKAAKSQELNQGPATEPAIEQANKPTPVASPKSPAVTSLDSEILAEIKAEKKAPAASEPEEPQYITKFRQYGPDKDDEDIRTSIELLNPEERNNLLKSQPWVYNKMTPEQQEQEFQLSRKSHPFSAGELIGGIGSIIGTGVDLAKSAAELGMDIADVRISAPIRQAIENKSWFEVKGRNDQIQKAQDKLDQDARNLASSVPAGIINTTRTVQKIFGGKDLNGISNNIQRAIATAAPILGQQIGVPIGVTQNIVGTPMPLQSGEKPNPWSMVPQTGYIPFDLVTKLAEATYNKDVGGFAALDRLNESLGLSDEEQSRNHDHIRRLYDAEVGAEDWKASVGEKKLSPWSQVAFSDIGQQAILLREKSMLPSAQFIADVDGTSIEEAEEKRERIAEANAEKATIELTKKWNKEYDPSMEFLGSLFIGDAGFGEAGLALGAGKLASPLIQKAKTLGMTDKEVSTYYAALQKLEKAKDIARQKKMSQPSWWGKSAGYVEQKQKDLSAAGQSLFERLPAPVQAAAPIAGKIATKVGLGGVGGGVGALLDPENPTAGLLEGITLTTALGTAPSIIRSIDTARRTIGAGEGKLFTQVAKSPESSLPARLIFNKATGPVIDYIAENGITLAKAGVNLGALSAITSTLNSDDPEDFNRAIAEGFGMGMGFHLAHGFAGKFHGKNPAQELKDRKKRDIEIHEAVKTASPATQGVLEQVTNYQTAIDRVDAFVARNERNLAEAIAKEDQKWIEMATTALKNSRALQREVLRANVQTRNEYGRSFLSTYADMNRLANGTRRAGQPNISIEILTPEQIVDLHVSENSRQGMTPDEIMAVRAQGESYAMEQGFFDRAKNRAVINAGHVLARTTLFGESPSDALRHEASHALDEIPEFKKLNEKTDRLLFTNEEKDLQGNVLKRTEGIYDDKALVEMYLNKYIGERNAEEKIAFSEQLGLWNRDTQSLNVPEVVKYMKAEVRAELTAGNLRSGLGKLMGAEATIANWIGMRQKQNFLARAIQSVTGLGAKPFGSELLNIEYTPEVIAANREAIKALNEFNGRFEANPEGFSGREMSEKEIRTNPVLRKRYGLNGGEFQTELKGVIRDANGKIVGKPVTIANPFAAEGNWSFDAEGNRKQTRGYGQVPDEFQGAQIPAGGSLEVYRDFVYEPDGKTPVRTKPSDLAKLEKDRGDLIRQALTDAAYDDSTTRLTPFSADGLSWSGIMSKSQVQAIKDIPESILPLSIKEKILAFNDSMARGDGSTFDIDYAPRLGRGKAYKGRKSDIYHIIPIGFGFSKAGNFYLRTLSLNAAFRKLKARAKLMQGWLDPWDNDPNLFMKEFQETYLNNTYEKRDGWLGLDPENPTQKTPLAEVKFGRFLDFMNMIGAETPPNPQRAATPVDPSARGRKKSKLGLEEDNQGIDNLWRSHRLDAIADIADTTEQTGRYRMDLDRVYKALMPAEPAPETPMEERRPSAINLGIRATYTPERKPFEARYVAPEGAALTASLVASGTSLESFGKESLAKLAEYYGITIPDGASRGEIIDSINERPIEAPVAAQPQETKFSFTTSTERDDAIKKLIATGDDQGIRDLNRTTILSALADLKNIQVAIEDAKGVYKGDKEVSSIIKVTTTSQQDLNRVRSRIADAAKMFQQMEFLEEKMGAGKRSLFGKTDEDGFKHIGSSTLYVEGVTDDQIEQARKQAGIDGLTLADGRIELYDRSDDPEFFNRVTALDTAIRQAGGVVTSSETGVASVKSYSEDPQRYAGTIGYDDQSLQIYSAAGESERLKTPLVQKLMGLMGRPMEAPKSGKRSYFEAKDLTPEQVKKQVGIAQRFTSLPLNDLANPLVKKAYERLNIEIGKQYDYLTEGKDGTKFTSQPYDLAGEPYESSADAINDIRTKNSLKFLKTDPSSFGPEGEDFSYHPLLQDSGRVDANGVKLTYNDLFRAVHDAIAHGLFGAEFGPIGEESAWQTHMRTLDDPWARWALTTETRGQNSYVNYREQMLGQDGMPLQKGDDGYIPLKERGFAAQKAALLPLEDSLTGDKKVDEVTRKLMNEIGEDQSQGSAGISFMPAEEKYPTGERGFYSGLQKTIDEKMPAKASPQQILSIVNNPQNAKPEEVKWSNLAGFLEGKQSVTKQEVLDYLRNEGSVKFEERTLGGKLQYNEKSEFLKKFPEIKNIYENSNNAADFRLQLDNSSTLYDELRRKGYGELADDPAFAHRIASDIFTHEPVPTQYSKYVLPNGENYREVVLTMPTGAENAELAYNDYNQSLREKYGVEDIGLVISEQEREIAQKLYEKINERYRGEYTSSHFPDIPNYVAHMRLDERPDAEGRDGLFIEEIQSDRHQQGREKGYAGENQSAKLPEGFTFEKIQTPVFDSGEGWIAKDPNGRTVGTVSPTRDGAEAQALRNINQDKQAISDAPFRKDWSVQMFKRALRDAIEGDKEWVGWTKGDTQAERFDLSKKVSEIAYWKEEEGYGLGALDLNGNSIIDQEFAKDEQSLSAMVGKDLAQKIVNDEGGDGTDYQSRYLDRRTGRLPDGVKVFTGEDLKVGGEGMKGFYDQILPKEIGKYVKKWGAKVEEGKIGQSISKEEMDMGDISDATPEELAQLEAQGMVAGPSVKIWKVEITPEMRESIQKGGQLAFMPRIDVVPERMQGTGDEPVTSNADWKKTKVLPAGGRRGKYVSPPPNFKKYDISDFTMGGKMFDKDTGEDVTDRIYSSASIDATGKRPALASSDEQPSDLGKGNQYKTNLFKKSAGWEWISDNPPEHSSLPSDGTEDPVLISVQGTFPDKGADHRYALKVNFDSPVKMARYSNEPNEPRLRPTAKGVIQYGNVIGQMRTSQGKVHNVYDTITIGEKPASDISFMPAAKLDEAHASAIESGDMKEAQRLVDERARKAGYNTPVYHGTTTASGEITIPVGRPELGIASHVTTSRDEAEYFSRLTTEYFKEDRDSPSAEPIVKKWYYKGETFDPENNSHIQRVEDAIKDVREIQGRFKSETDDYNPETWKTKTYDFFEKNIDIIQAIKRAGFDGYKDRESIDYKWSETPNIAIFEPNNIKSADPATYDNEGKLIPLSQRFDTSKQDIRFMPYSPELPKTEDGKVDWAGFKTRTQETAKPLADLSPIGGVSFMASKKEDKSPMPMSALNVLHSDSDVLPKPDKKVANAKVAVQLADIAEQHHGRVITSNDITLEEEQKFIQNGADEAESALKASGKNAGNWYSTAMKAAVAVAGVIHKVISDPKEAMKNPHFAKEPDPTKAAQFAFLIPLAITSQNQTVPLNTRYGEEQFNHFQKTGKFDPTKIYGEKAASISGNLELANHLIDVMGGLTKLEDFVKQEFSVKELEDAASKIAGRKITIAGRKTDMVNGAAIFGPKIGQGFLQNLMGKFDPVTIDLWMRRTWGRWTGDVVGDGVTGVRLGRLIQEYRNSGRRLPDSLKNLRTVMRSTGTTSTGKPTKPELTVSGNVQDRIETDPEFRKSIEQLSKEANAEFQGYYKLMGSPVSDAMILEINKVAPAGKIKYSEETRNERDFAYNKLIKEQLKIKNDLDEKWGQLSSVEKKALNAEDPKKAISKAKWIEQQHANAGRTKVLANEQKNAIKPQWASAAKSIVADLNPIDIPTDQDRVVISRVVNGIRKTLESRGYNVTNADVQAILWYPEKDLWAKLRGEEESNLKQSYDDELLKIAEQRGYGEEARAVAKRIRGY